VRTFVLILLVSITACTGGNGTPTPPELPTDPCAYLTINDVESATGEQVSGAEGVPVDNMVGPQFPTCMYKTGGRDGSIWVSVNPQGAETYAQVRDRDPANTLAVQNIGDEAFVYALAALWVRVGDGFFVVGTQHDAGASGVETLKALARDAIAHLPTAS